MDLLIPLAVDVAAIAVLAFAVYYPRHRRRDLLVALVGVNVGVFAVAAVLGTSTIGAGVGLGLFGVLSIIRLRSYEISQREISYYFAALAIGLVLGLPVSNLPLQAGLAAIVVVALWIVDHPGVLPRARQHVVTVDRAIADERELEHELASRLGGPVTAFTVQRVDFVDDVTVVDVRYRTAVGSRRGRSDHTVADEHASRPAAARTGVPVPPGSTR